jgi:predicted methyltransferase
MYNRQAASPASKPEQILEILDIHPGGKVADIGSGGGYYALRFAQAVGNEGHVYAVDTNPEFLKNTDWITLPRCWLQMARLAYRGIVWT